MNRWRPQSILAICVIAWAAGFLMTGDTLMPVRLGIYVIPMIMVLAVTLAVASVARRRWLLATLLGGIAAGLFTLQAPPLLRAVASESTQPAPGITVVSLSNRTLNEDMVTTARMIRAQNADIFVLQEVAHPETLVQALAKLPGPSLAHCQSKTFMVFSRFQVGSPHPSARHGVMICPVALPWGETWVGSVHLPRAIYSRHAQSRVVDHLTDMLDQLSGPKIVAGDFNATPLTSPIRRIERYMVSAFTAAGQGFGFTFPTPARRMGSVGPFLQIDYIFYSDDLLATHAEVLSDHPPAADHFPIRAVLQHSNNAQ